MRLSNYDCPISDDIQNSPPRFAAMEEMTTIDYLPGEPAEPLSSPPVVNGPRTFDHERIRRRARSSTVTHVARIADCGGRSSKSQTHGLKQNRTFAVSSDRCQSWWGRPCESVNCSWSISLTERQMLLVVT